MLYSTKAYKDADKHTWKKEELIAYDNATIAEQDERGKISAAKNKGKIEGKIEEKEKVVARCLQKGLDIEDIAEIAELPIDEVLKLIERIKKRKKDNS